MLIRLCLVEHPFGTIKSCMGATHFMRKGFGRLKMEMSLHVLAYNFKRLMMLLGAAHMMEVIRAYALLFAVQRMIEAIVSLVRSAPSKNQHSLLIRHADHLVCPLERFRTAPCGTVSLGGGDGFGGCAMRSRQGAAAVATVPLDACSSA